MTNKTFGFGVIGTGVIAEFHAKAISEIPNAKLLGVYNRTKSKSDKFAKKFSCKSYSSLEELLKNTNIDSVCICTPSGTHLEPALKCMESGKHCLIEKPLEINVERCDRILQAAEEFKLKVGVVFPSRFYKACNLLKRALNENRFGDIVLTSAYVKWHRSPEYYKSGKWRGTWQFDGGGALMNQGIHSVDLLQWYGGDVEEVQAFSSNVFHKGIEVEDTVVAAVKFKNGALGSLECSTAVYPGSSRRIEIKGTEGSAVLEGNKITEWAFRDKKEYDNEVRNMIDDSFGDGESDPKTIGHKGHQMQIEDFIRAIRENKKPAINIKEGKKSVSIVEAVYESVNKEKKIIIK